MSCDAHRRPPNPPELFEVPPLLVVGAVVLDVPLEAGLTVLTLPLDAGVMVLMLPPVAGLTVLTLLLDAGVTVLTFPRGADVVTDGLTVPVAAGEVRSLLNEPEARLVLVLLPGAVVVVVVWRVPVPVVVVLLPLKVPPVLLLPSPGLVPLPLFPLPLFTVTRVELFIPLPAVLLVSPLFHRSLMPVCVLVPV